MRHGDLFVPKPEQIEQLRAEFGQGTALIVVGRALAACLPQHRYESLADCCRRALRGQARRAEIDPEQLVHVGHFDETVGEIRLHPGCERLIGAWIGRQLHRDDIEASDSLHNQRQQARRDMRNAYMRGDISRAASIASRHGISHW